jgi:hypothetical protein
MITFYYKNVFIVIVKLCYTFIKISVTFRMSIMLSGETVPYKGGSAQLIKIFFIQFKILFTRVLRSPSLQ